MLQLRSPLPSGDGVAQADAPDIVSFRVLDSTSDERHEVRVPFHQLALELRRRDPTHVVEWQRGRAQGVMVLEAASGLSERVPTFFRRPVRSPSGAVEWVNEPRSASFDVVDLEGFRRVLLRACPQLAAVPMIGTPGPDAGSLYGARLYFPTEAAERLPEILEAVNQRLVLDGQGWASMLENGDVVVRTAFDPESDVYRRDPRAFVPPDTHVVEWSPESRDSAWVVHLALNAAEFKDFRRTSDRIVQSFHAFSDDRAEQLASLVGDAGRVFFQCLREKTGDALWEEWHRLQEAATRDHQLGEVFRSAVVGHALALRPLSTDKALFDLALSSRLEKEPELTKLDLSEVQLLRDAAWVLAAPASLLVGKGSGPQGELRRPSKAAREEAGWLVDRWLPRRGVGALVGEPGHGKSFVVADLAARVALPSRDPLTGDATPRRFAGRTVLNGPVLYFGSEDVDGWSLRAGRQLNDLGESPDVGNALYIAEGVPPLSNPSAAIRAVRDRVEQIRELEGTSPVLIVIDVLRAAVDGDENESGDMDFAMTTAHSISRMVDCYVLLVHHARKKRAGDLETRSRGSGAIDANCDFIGTVEKRGAGEAATYRLTVTKSKNSVGGATFEWHIPHEDAPLKEGLSSSVETTDTLGIGKRRAEALGRAIRQVATTTRGVTLSELNDAALEGYPHLFRNGDKVNRQALSTAKGQAFSLGFLVEGQRGKLLVGPTAPPVDRTQVTLSPVQDLLDGAL